MVESSEADIPLICGDNCIALKEFTRDGALELVSTSLETLSKAFRHLSDKAKGHNFVKEPPYPIFEGVSDHKTRALMCIYLGCDVYVKGMKGVGPKT